MRYMVDMRDMKAKLKRMVRSRVFSCSESDGPGTVKSYKVEVRAEVYKGYDVYG